MDTLMRRVSTRSESRCKCHRRTPNMRPMHRHLSHLLPAQCCVHSAGAPQWQVPLPHAAAQHCPPELLRWPTPAGPECPAGLGLCAWAHAAPARGDGCAPRSALPHCRAGTQTARSWPVMRSQGPLPERSRHRREYLRGQAGQQTVGAHNKQLPAPCRSETVSKSAVPRISEHGRTGSKLPAGLVNHPATYNRDGQCSTHLKVFCFAAHRSGNPALVAAAHGILPHNVHHVRHLLAT